MTFTAPPLIFPYASPSAIQPVGFLCGSVPLWSRIPPAHAKVTMDGKGRCLDTFAVRADAHAGDTIPVHRVGEHLLALLGVPQIDGVVPTPREQPLAVATQGQAADRSGVPAQGEGFLAAA